MKMFETAKWIWVDDELKKISHFCYFRKKFFSKKNTDVFIHCYADSKYRLWVNGKYIGFGPARGKAEFPYYDTYRVKIKKGENILCFLVQHYCEKIPIFESIEPGLLCQIELNSEIICVSDSSWKAKTAVTYSPLPGRYFPSECFDARLEPENWFGSEFDDKNWQHAIEKQKPQIIRQFIPRPIPFIKEKQINPEKILDIYRSVLNSVDDFFDKEKISESLWNDRKLEIKLMKLPGKWRDGISIPLRAKEAICMIIDFGFETLAFIEITVKAKEGIIVDFAHSECLWNNKVPTLWQSPQVKQPHRIITKDGKTCYRTNQPRGFRYLVVRLFNPFEYDCEVKIDSIKAYEAIYPVKMQGNFSCSDSLLNEIYHLCARTVNLCMEDAYTDCPWRERSQWIGDSQPEALINYYCFGAYELSKKAIIEFTSGNTDEGWIPGFCPGDRKINLPTFGMRIPVIIWQYYLFTGDYETLKQAYSGMQKQVDWLIKHTDENGFFDLNTGWNFVDWSGLDSSNADGAVQGWFFECLIYASKIAKEIGDKQSEKKYKEFADTLKKNIEKFYWNKGKKAFLKYRKNSPKKPFEVPDDIIGQHENFLFSLLGIGNNQQRKLAIDNLAGKTGLYLPKIVGDRRNYLGEQIIKIGSPFWSFYALLSLLEAKKYDAAINYIRLCWGLMLEFGATSCWEMWDRQTSLCHGWSGGPGMILPAYILGVKPLKPGFKEFEIRPLVFDLDWAKGTVPTPAGNISVMWKISDKRIFRISIDVPETLTGKLIVPEQFCKKTIVVKSGKHQFLFKGRKI